MLVLDGGALSTSDGGALSASDGGADGALLQITFSRVCGAFEAKVHDVGYILPLEKKDKAMESFSTRKNV